MNAKLSEILRTLPSMTTLLAHDRVRAWSAHHPRALVASALRSALDNARTRILANGSEPTGIDADPLISEAESIMKRSATPSLRRVINATGIVLHTGLGRAPLAKSAVDALTATADGYMNLEYDLETGARGRRQDHVASLICAVTGAEAATVVNNNAAATLLLLRALCADREVVISRGQLVEIGGSFRMPDIMATGGAIMREVGTTNRTHLSDYERAIGDNTAALIRVHCSNFRVVGFTGEPSPAELVDCAHRHNLLALDDLGSGAMFDFTQHDLPPEPCVTDSVRAGFDLTCFSADKLLGGPQAGIINGRADLVRQIESHPLMRTYRLDKLVLLALEATLRHYLDTESATREIPTLSMLQATPDTLRPRAERLKESLASALPGECFDIGEDTSFAGGGSLPAHELPTVVVRWRPAKAPLSETVAQLRTAPVPVVARIADDHVIFDLRTIRDNEFEDVIASARFVIT